MNRQNFGVGPKWRNTTPQKGPARKELRSLQEFTVH
jgi:hypothetical protein